MMLGVCFPTHRQALPALVHSFRFWGAQHSLEVHLVFSLPRAPVHDAASGMTWTYTRSKNMNGHDRVLGCSWKEYGCFTLAPTLLHSLFSKTVRDS